jgi:hypothetical protein
MLLEATVTPLTSLPTAHPSPEAALTLAPRPDSRPSEDTSARFTRTVVSEALLALVA